MKGRYFSGHVMVSWRNIDILGPNTCQGHWITDLIASSDIRSPFTCAFTPFPSLMLLKKETKKRKAHPKLLEQPCDVVRGGGSVLTITRLSFPSLKPRAPSTAPGFDSRGSDTEDLDMRLSTWQCWMRKCSVISVWGKKALKVDGYLNVGVWSTASHLFTKINRKKMCNVSGIPSRSHLINKCREKSSLPLHIATNGGFFLKQLLQKASGVCRYFRQSKM